MNFQELEQEEEVAIPMAPLIDIVFLCMVFFISISLFARLESELSITIPHAQEAQESRRTPGEIIINVDRQGDIIVNQRLMTLESLSKMLKQLSRIYQGEAIIIRGDTEATHGRMMEILNSCAASDIWNVSFAVLKDDEKSQ